MTALPDSDAAARLREAGLRPTRQRIVLARRLFGGPDRHVTAAELHAEVLREEAGVSLATVYNTLHQFTKAGLLRELVVDAGPSFFDTNTTASPALSSWRRPAAWSMCRAIASR